MSLGKEAMEQVSKSELKEYVIEYVSESIEITKTDLDKLSGDELKQSLESLKWYEKILEDVKEAGGIDLDSQYELWTDTQCFLVDIFEMRKADINDTFESTEAFDFGVELNLEYVNYRDIMTLSRYGVENLSDSILALKEDSQLFRDYVYWNNFDSSSTFNNIYADKLNFDENIPYTIVNFNTKEWSESLVKEHGNLFDDFYAKYYPNIDEELKLILEKLPRLTHDIESGLSLPTSSRKLLRIANMSNNEELILDNISGLDRAELEVLKELVDEKNMTYDSSISSSSYAQDLNISKTNDKSNEDEMSR